MSKHPLMWLNARKHCFMYILATLPLLKRHHWDKMIQDPDSLWERVELISVELLLWYNREKRHHHHDIGLVWLHLFVFLLFLRLKLKSDFFFFHECGCFHFFVLFLKRDKSMNPTNNGTFLSLYIKWILKKKKN